MVYIDFCNRTQLETYSPLNQDYFRNVSIGWVNGRTFYEANLTATDEPCTLLDDYWWLCSDGINRKRLPAGWKSMCTIGPYLQNTAGRIHSFLATNPQKKRRNVIPINVKFPLTRVTVIKLK